MTEEELKKEAEEKGIKYADSLEYTVSDEEGYSWSQVEEAYEKGALDFAESREKRIADLEWQLKEVVKDNDYYQAENEKLIQENAELKGEANSVLDNWCRGDDPCPHLKKRDEQLTKAKEIINAFLDFEASAMERGCYIADDTRKRAEDFIK